jgi:hypothetical protein
LSPIGFLNPYNEIEPNESIFADNHKFLRPGGQEGEGGDVMKERLLSRLSVFLVTVSLSACALLPLGTLLPMAGTAYNGYIVWRSGEATKYYAYDVDTTHQAVLAASQQLKIEPRVIKSAPASDYVLETKGRVPMQIEISPYEKGVTKVIIRISPFGDKNYVELFYKLVDEHLANKTAAGREEAPRK